MKYEEVSRQNVNLQKPHFFFGKGSREEDKGVLNQVIGTNSEALSERYLGLPTVLGRLKDSTFKHVTESLKGKVAGWMGQGMSKAAREVLIKSVLQATPTYTMSCFHLTNNSISSKFWWGSEWGEEGTLD